MCQDGIIARIRRILGSYGGALVRTYPMREKRWLLPLWIPEKRPLVWMSKSSKGQPSHVLGKTTRDRRIWTTPLSEQQVRIDRITTQNLEIREKPVVRSGPQYRANCMRQ